MAKVLVITGASSGIGLVAANYFHNMGYVVYGLSRSKPNSVSWKHLICDVSEKEELEKAVENIIQQEKQLDVFINNAGMGISGSIEHTKEEELEKIISVNIKGVVYASQVVLPHLRKSKGILINIGSVAGELTIPFQGFYSMSKAAVMSITEALAMEVKPHGVRVCAVLPGDTKTSFTKNREKSNEIDPLYQERIHRSILKMEQDEQKGKDPITVAKAIKKAIRRKNPPIAIVVGASYKTFVFLKRLLPNRIRLALLYLLYGK